jgi:hypothetical protein
MREPKAKSKWKTPKMIFLGKVCALKKLFMKCDILSDIGKYIQQKRKTGNRK